MQVLWTALERHITHMNRVVPQHAEEYNGNAARHPDPSTMKPL